MRLARPALKPLLHRCQALLALGDWQISIRYVRPDQVGENEVACIFPNREHRMAEILIVDPWLRDRSDMLRVESVRELVLHELLHLYIANEDKEREEQAIIAIARALDKVW